MVQTALKGQLMLACDAFSDQFLSDRGYKNAALSQWSDKKGFGEIL